MKKECSSISRWSILILLFCIFFLANQVLPTKSAAEDIPGPDQPVESPPFPGYPPPPDTTQNAGNPPGDSLDSDIVSQIFEAMF